MKKIFYLISFASCLFVFQARAKMIDIYAGLELSAGQNIAFIPSNSVTGSSDEISKSANSYGMFFGVEMPAIRVELEYQYLNSKSVDLNALMLNGYYKFLPGPMVSPYIGAGVGTAFSGNYGDEATDTSTAFQAMLGLQVSFPTTPIYLDIEARGFYANDIYEIPTTDKTIGFLQYDVRAKLRYLF